MKIWLDKNWMLGAVLISGIVAGINYGNHKRDEALIREACLLFWRNGYYKAQLSVKRPVSRGQEIIDSLYANERINALFE